jgi:hypothetical protein
VEEFPHELCEIMTGEFLFKRLGDLLEGLLEEMDLRGQLLECSVVVGCKKFPLKDRKVDLNLFESTGMHRERDKDQMWPPSVESSGSFLSAVRGAVVDNLEHTARRAIRFPLHDRGYQTVEARDAGFRFAAAEDPCPMDLPRQPGSTKLPCVGTRV